MSVSSYFATIAETSDKHFNENCKTRYYRTKYTKIKESLELYAKENGYEITKENDDFKEIFLQKPSHHIIATAVQFNPLETGVDLKVQVYKIIGKNMPFKTISKVYSYLDKHHQFKGVGLHQ